MRYRGVEYQKIRGYWRALPGQGTGERGAGRIKRKVKREPREPQTFWECVNESNGRHCDVHHRTRTGCVRHVRQLDKQAWRVGGRAARRWEPFKVIDGIGYHFGVGAPK